MRVNGGRGDEAGFEGKDKGRGGMAWRLGFADDSSPDLIVHGVLGMERSMDQIREEMRGILERLVSLQKLWYPLFTPILVTATQSIPWRYRPTPHQERDREKTER
jgi:hypothetical protein